MLYIIIHSTASSLDQGQCLQSNQQTAHNKIFVQWLGKRLNQVKYLKEMERKVNKRSFELLNRKMKKASTSCLLPFSCAGSQLLVEWFLLTHAHETIARGSSTR